MNCKEVREFLLSGEAESEMSGDKLPDIYAHLKACRECAEIDFGIRNIKEYAERFREILPPEKVWSNVRDEIFKEERSVNIIFPRFPALTLAISTAVFLIIFTIFILKNRKGYEDFLYEFVGTQAEFLVSLEAGDTTLYEPLSDEEN